MSFGAHPSSMTGQTWSDNVFNLNLPTPMDLPRLADCADLEAPNHAETLFGSLPLRPSPPAGRETSHEELADTLGFTELPIRKPGYAWPPISEECVQGPS